MSDTDPETGSDNNPGTASESGPNSGHIPVLIEPVINMLSFQPGQVVLDCTLGRGGHAAKIIPLIGPGGTYIGLDLDGGNIEFARQRLEPVAEAAGVSLHLFNQSFAAADEALAKAGANAADRILADLGFASNQVDDPKRGLSFRHDGPLDMRLDPAGPTTAADLVNSLGEKDLADLIYRYGEERLSRRIARKIVASRADRPIHTTGALAELCRHAYGPRGRSARIDPATRTFQALRIAVNGELDALDVLLKRLPSLLAADGLAGLISFHSLEDRPIKRAFLAAEQAGKLERVTRKPVVADSMEQASNPRSRSAKLRIARKTSSAETDALR